MIGLTPEEAATLRRLERKRDRAIARARRIDRRWREAESKHRLTMMRLRHGFAAEACCDPDEPVTYHDCPRCCECCGCDCDRWNDGAGYYHTDGRKCVREEHPYA